MSLEMLLAQFDCVIETAEDIVKLNTLILRSAIQGKLVQQNPADESAKELFKRIKAEQKRLVQFTKKEQYDIMTT